ncbi:hypothetical protein PUMCH_000295 [Australozyma saopauloensis]|uniref:Uncharacterized protein n=1 Tax=Australozyma saopauloensis TaxID=291208 RepID=A0AAX4H3F5_9ASCO|nr:hypothetical protein PUMCH_000295 [[Candida] saopauloensis]
MVQLGKRRSTILSSFSSRRSLRTIVTGDTPSDQMRTINSDHSSRPNIRSRVVAAPSSTSDSSLDSLTLESPLASTFRRSETFSAYSSAPSETSFDLRKFGGIPRSTHCGNISSYVGSKNVLPLGNRQSMAFEIQELESLCSQISSPDEDLQLHLVENAIFMTFCLKEADRINNTSTRYWDDLDAEEIFKNDTMQSESLLIH